MKLLTKKIYCSACCRLVKGREQKSNSNIHVICSRCGKLLSVWNGVYWKPAGKVS